MKRNTADLISPAGNPPDAGVVVRNRQRQEKINTPAAERFAAVALELMESQAEVCFHLVSAREMARLNWQFLQHEGSTDVITFDQGSAPGRLRGEIFISVADAQAQAEEFGTTWQDELGRYMVHGLLHLAGYDDLQPSQRKIMKRLEERLMRQLRKCHPPATFGGS
ncbi:MAG TPA: rRNA maturation RNase YbeY [Candidatus Limnocylindria bacterium]|nr:rRNA maturation RNase YbeY [Candidatus Limnocylindria bacterium]